MEAEPLTYNREMVHIATDKVLAFIKVGPTNLNNEWEVAEVNATLVVLKVLVAGIVFPNEMSVIGTLKISLDD